MTYLRRNRVSTPALSLALIGLSGLWFASAGIYYVTSGFRSDWSATPLLWMLTALVTPAVCFSGGLILMDARKRAQFSWMEYGALAAISVPITLGTVLAVWAVRGLLVMSGVSIG